MVQNLLRDSLITGTVACAATLAVAMICGAQTRSGPVAPINATSHVLHGEHAAQALGPDLRHTVPGAALNEGAGIFWSILYEGLFGRAGERGDLATAIAGGGAVAALAYFVDYHLVPKRLTPGWEHHLSRRALAIIYGALALSFPVRGVFRYLAKP